MKLLFLPSLVSVLLAQSLPPDEVHSRTVPYVPPIRTEVRVVEVPAVVRDSHFRAIAGLTRDDFEIDDNGKKQPITSFSVQTFEPHAAATAAGVPPPPRFLALCFDDLHLSPALLEPVKDAAVRFVKTSLAPNDLVTIVRTSRSEKSKFTADAAALLDQIGKVSAAPQIDAGDSVEIHMLPHEAYQIANHQDPGDRLLHAKMAECSAHTDPRSPCREGQITGVANSIWTRTRSASVNTLNLIASLVDGMAKLPGRRMIVLTSSGFLTSSLDGDVDRLMDQARHAEVVINGVDARGQSLNTSGGMSYDSLGIFASGTGGTFFHNNSDLAEGFRNLAMVPETTYLLGFSPPGATDGSFHKLKVRLTAGKGYSVEARLGYTAQPTTAAPTLDTEATASDTRTNLPASFTWEQWSGPSAITMIAHLDIAHLHFKPNQDRRAQKVTFIAVLLDPQGAYVAGKRSELQLNLKDATYEQLAKTGFTAALTIQAPPGAYAVRAVAQDAMEGNLAAASSEVNIK